MRSRSKVVAQITQLIATIVETKHLSCKPEMKLRIINVAETKESLKASSSATRHGRLRTEFFLNFHFPF